MSCRKLFSEDGSDCDSCKHLKIDFSFTAQIRLILLNPKIEFTYFYCWLLKLWWWLDKKDKLDSEHRYPFPKFLLRMQLFIFYIISWIKYHFWLNIIYKTTQLRMCVCSFFLTPFWWRDYFCTTYLIVFYEQLRDLKVGKVLSDLH